MASPTYFELPKKIVYTIISFLIVGLLSVGGMVVRSHIKENDKTERLLGLKDVSLGEAINTNQVAIQLNNERIMAEGQKTAVLEEKVKGHEKSKSAHTN